MMSLNRISGFLARCAQWSRSVRQQVFIQFIGVTLVNKITQVSGVQFCDTPAVYRTVCSPPRVKSPSCLFPFYLLPPLSLWSPHTVVSVRIFSLLNPCTFFLFYKDFIYLLVGRGRKRGRETLMCEDTSIGCLLHATIWGPGRRPRPVPWLGTEPAAFLFTGRRSVCWATAARPKYRFHAAPAPLASDHCSL